MLAVGGGPVQARQAPTAGEPPRPFHRAGPAEYVGPGREEPPPEGLQEVRLGYFGPNRPDDPEGGAAWQAAQLAIEEANAAGGYRGLPFRLVAAWSENPWGSGVAGVARLVYDEGVWAIVGGIDGPSTHLVEQVVAKARLTLISPGSTDESVNLTSVPWMLSCLAPDSRLAEPLAAALLEAAAGGPFVLISATDHDSHATMLQVRSTLSRRHVAAPSLDLELEAGSPDVAGLIDEALREAPHAVLVVAGASDAARLVRGLRQRYAGPIIGGPKLGRQRFLAGAGEAAEGLELPRLFEASDEWERFARSFDERFGRRPDYLAGRTYDAVALLVEAIRHGGLNRARILDAARALVPWSGVTGPIDWDPQGRNRGAVPLGVVRSGRLLPTTPTLTKAGASPEGALP